MMYVYLKPTTNYNIIIDLSKKLKVYDTIIINDEEFYKVEINNIIRLMKNSYFYSIKEYRKLKINKII